MSVRKHPEAQLLRFTTAGSVDDGKSTLIGRLLYDCKSIFEDQMEALERSSDLSGGGRVNLANLTDGLRAEREQGITIDVAYRYFSTPRRSFIIADTPGHEQYTRNMVTGASTANLAIVLVDARNGVVVQSRRHAFIASLLRIPHLVVAINKMDLMGYARETFERIRDDFRSFAGRLSMRDIFFVPISALEGDNIVDRSARMKWYDGPTLLEHLETVEITEDRNLADFRFPVQYVIRPDLDFRGYAGQIASGVVRKGAEVEILPTGRRSRITGIHTFDGELDEAFAPQSVTITLADEIDISRGNMIVSPENRPVTARDFEADICWMHENPPIPSKKYYMKHASQVVPARIEAIVSRIDLATLESVSCDGLRMNDLGLARVRTAKPIFLDSYEKNRQTGSFVLMEEGSNSTVAGGMIR